MRLLQKVALEEAKAKGRDKVVARELKQVIINTESYSRPMVRASKHSSMLTRTTEPVLKTLKI